MKLPFARKPASRRRKAQELYLVRPTAAETDWELWTISPGAPRLKRNFEFSNSADVKGLRTVALPVQHVLGFARWLQTAEETLLPAMVGTLLDREGLQSRRNGGQQLSWEILAREENRTLVVIRTLPGGTPESYSRSNVRRYECSADLLELAPDSLALWLENGRLVAAFTRAGRAVHLQSFSGPEITGEIATELFCTLLQLSTEEVLLKCEAIELRAPFPPEQSALLAQILERPLLQRETGPPVLPGKISELLPARAASLRLAAVRAERIRRVLAGAAVVYVLFILGSLLHVGFLTWKKNRLSKEIVADRPTVETIRNTSQRWHSLEAAITPAIYPLEVLYQSSGLLPADGVRFTLFEQRANRVTIRGEASDAAAAFKLVEDIKKHEELNYFDWEMPRPNILPNDKAEFQIQGTPPDAPAN